ncbi:MAG: hypothetical protein V3V00_16135 [Saprospiraceae bacterium]
MKIKIRKLKISQRKPKESDSCGNCFFDTYTSNLEPCFSCTRNPVTSSEDNWAGNEYEDD